MGQSIQSSIKGALPCLLSSTRLAQQITTAEAPAEITQKHSMAGVGRDL